MTRLSWARSRWPRAVIESAGSLSVSGSASQRWNSQQLDHDWTEGPGNLGHAVDLPTATYPWRVHAFEHVASDLTA
jgi:hypothetical protein